MTTKSDGAFQLLINNLVQFNKELSRVGDSLKQIETNEIDNFKDNIRFKSDLLGRIKESSEHIQEFKTIINALMDKMEVKNGKLLSLLNEIKQEINSPKIDVEKLSKNICEDLKKEILSNDNFNSDKKWSKFFFWGFIFELMIILALLGLNLFEKIKLPMPF